MPRPKSCRRIVFDPAVTFYKPQGIPLKNLKSIQLTHEEWEALRLKHVEELDQKASAVRMATSQSTIQRILSSGQKKLGQAIVNGWAIAITKK